MNKFQKIFLILGLVIAILLTMLITILVMKNIDPKSTDVIKTESVKKAVLAPNIPPAYCTLIAPEE